ncbi:MAG: Na(+)/H(+) antiporter subunit D [Elusimicrobiota bacterium]|nr:Na(+)/H(+) antiporter subunit D [Elusimicrobiota bacterium]
MSELHPAFLLWPAAVLAVFLRGRAGAALAVAAPLAALAFLPQAGASAGVWTMAGFSLEPLRVDALARLFAAAFCLAAALGGLYAFSEESPLERAAGLAMAGAAAGVCFAGDWVTLFFCWEALTMASLALIWAAGPRARGAGLRYLLVHAAGGGALLSGLLLLRAAGAPMALSSLVSGGAPMSPAAWLILGGVALNAAVPPLHAWLTDAYPRCSPAGSVLQSAFTTKAAVYVLLRVFPGADVLVVLGSVMAVYGVIYAVMESDARRLLSYHIISQVGYMVAGAGLGTELAVSGASAHAFSHILYKALLFMGAGALVHCAGTAHLAELGGLYGRLRPVFWLYMAGALAISGAPGFNGFISKPLIGLAAEQAGWNFAATMLHLASAGTFLSVALKLPYLAFFGAERGKVLRQPSAGMLLAMGAAAVLCVATGLYPAWLYARLPFPVDYHPFAFSHVRGTLELLAGIGLAFWLLRRGMKGEKGLTLDFDWFYRVPLAAVVTAAAGALQAAGAGASAAAAKTIAGGAALLRERRPEAFPPVGGSLMWLAAAFALAVLLAR